MVGIQYINADFIQLLIARHYEPKYGAGHVCFGNVPMYDVSFDRGPRLEIKLDMKAASTGNAAIEYWNSHSDKPTGILSTCAEKWVHVVPYAEELRCFEVDVKRLLRLCFETSKYASGGDGSSTLMVLIPLLKLKAGASQVFRLDDELGSLKALFR
jgi:hypothetical protein